MVEFIVNQDRTRIYPCLAQSYFNIKDSAHNGVLIGYSLYMDRKYLGTYEKRSAALNELANIHNGREHIYSVDGYSEYEF